METSAYRFCGFGEVNVISKKDIEEYYGYLLNAFKNEFFGNSRREAIEKKSSGPVFSENEREFLKKIVNNGFDRKNVYGKISSKKYKYNHPIELIDYIISEGYTPSSPFIKWVYSRLKIKWDVMHWFRFIMRDIAPVDLAKIKKEMNHIHEFNLPETLELYYRTGTGLECLRADPLKGIKFVIQKAHKDKVSYRGFDPLEYLDYYYGGLDEETMTIAKALYSLLLKNRNKLTKNTTALIVGNGPIPDEAQTLSMIPEIKEIIPADIDPRNIKMMEGHTGNKNPLSTQKARPGEEHADFIYYLFEKYNKISWGLFPVREITSVKTKNPFYIDVSKDNPMDMPKNSKEIKNLKAELIVVPFCPESITHSLEKYKEYIKNISHLILPKRHLCMLALKGANYYKSGRKTLQAVPINEGIVCEELVKNGFENVEITTIKMNLKDKRRGFSDSMIIWADKK